MKWLMKDRHPYPEILSDFDQRQFCPEMVAELEHIMVSVPKAEIVISSTWRRLHTLSDIRGFITKAGGSVAGSRIIDKTCFLPNDIRGLEIQRWVDQFEPERFVILDDDTDMTDEQKANGHFIHINEMDGLTRAAADRAIAVLNS